MKEDGFFEEEPTGLQLAALQQEIQDLRAQIIGLQVELNETRRAQLRHEHTVWGRAIMMAPRSLAWFVLYWVHFLRLVLRGGHVGTNPNTVKES